MLTRVKRNIMTLYFLHGCVAVRLKQWSFTSLQSKCSIDCTRCTHLRRTERRSHLAHVAMACTSDPLRLQHTDVLSNTSTTRKGPN